MGCCSTVLKLLLITSLSIGSILLYLHVECQRELEEKNSDKFNDVYNPDETDCVAELPFVKAGTESVDINLGIVEIFYIFKRNNFLVRTGVYAGSVASVSSDKVDYSHQNSLAWSHSQ